MTMTEESDLVVKYIQEKSIEVFLKVEDLSNPKKAGGDVAKILMQVYQKGYVDGFRR